ncbi:hypothetical protein ASF62_11460 [Leifsonia sp. Leaf325]|nr:IclR family transcriptional regulator [Leifsonia sp. Leaf325]KQQ94672.1 hypothetical protein ASF62_11460 [Leifsonia sp. Leaf325]
MRTADWTDSVSVLDRVTAVFDAFGDHDEGLGISELARRANLPKSTVSRIAADLVTQRFLDRDGDRLYLGVRLFELAMAVERPRRLRHAALPVMTDLRDVTGHSVQLAVLEDDDVVFVMVMRGGPESKPAVRVGERLPARGTALGKAMLAFSPPAVLERLIAGAPEGLDGRVPGDQTELRRGLSDIRKSGLAVEKEMPANDRVCVAAPILGLGGVPIAAISVVGSAPGLVPERIGPAVRAAAMALGRRLGAEHVR